jgi:phenylacetate-coenzyme A ligase PaaK-like adenylate-forming protein
LLYRGSFLEKIQEKLFVKAFDIDGLTEIIGPGVAAECERRSGSEFRPHTYRTRRSAARRAH